jgi:tRNA (cytidine/uridine-2'-O-)-methyltransferase
MHPAAVAKPELAAATARPARPAAERPPIMRLALFQPDIPQNAGALIRLGACLGVPVDVIEPCGFVLSDRRLRRAGMDYVGAADLTRHESWAAFCAARSPAARLVLLTTAGTTLYHRFTFARDDIIVLGRESAGAPPEVHAASAGRLIIPMRKGLRSLNVALAAAMVLGEALRQTQLFPGAEA